MDYYRSVYVSLMQNPDQRDMVDKWSEMIMPSIDDMQLAIDKQRACGQVHMAFRVQR